MFEHLEASWNGQMEWCYAKRVLVWVLVGHCCIVLIHKDRKSSHYMHSTVKLKPLAPLEV